MAKSTIKTLPKHLRDQLNEWLQDESISQVDATKMLNDLLAEMGEKPRSKSAVNRYAMQMDEIGKRIQQSREMADMWIGRFGNQPQGKVGQLLNELIRNLAFNTTLELSETGEAVDSKVIKELAQAVEKLEQASTINEKRQREIERAMLEKASAEAEKAVIKAGLSKETANDIKKQILGIE